MTIDEAIKHQEDLEQELDIPQRENQRKAVKLGIEALKFIKGLHDTGAMPSNARLPGETEE